MNSGVFLYVPKNVVIEEPIESLFIQDSDSNQPFFKHVLIVADNHSEFSYLERFNPLVITQKASGNIVVEVIAKDGAKVKYSAVDQLGQTVTTYMNRRGYIMRDASVDWALGVMNDGDVVADFDSDLLAKALIQKLKSLQCAGKQTQASTHE